MAKLRGAAKKAFLAKMARGREKAAAQRKAAGGGKRKRRRAAPTRAKARRRTDEGRKHTHWGQVAAHERRVNPVAYVVNPGRRKRRKKHMAKKSRRHRRRNPGMGGIMTAGRATMNVALPALAAGFAGNFIETKIPGGKVGRLVFRLAAATAAGMLLRTRPAMASASMGALLGPIGGDFATNIAGGVKAGDMKELAEIIADREDMAELAGNLRGFGVLLGPMDGMGNHEDSADAGAELGMNEEDAA